uniref:Uncharacterized protein n=1 Tax=Oryza rufipogon TaxID=4529 RepID=A0A0E0PCF6_ORYRU
MAEDASEWQRRARAKDASGRQRSTAPRTRGNDDRGAAPARAIWEEGEGVEREYGRGEGEGKRRGAHDWQANPDQPANHPHMQAHSCTH